MVTSLANLTESIQNDIDICKSDSEICGYKLRKAHYKLGREMGNLIQANELSSNELIGVYILMRAGLFFGLGISDEIESLGYTTDIYLSSTSSIGCIDEKYDKVIIVDAVINSGETVVNLLNSLTKRDVIIATNVISSSHMDKFNDIKTYAVRVSDKSFKGSKNKVISNGKGPDTGDRLFNSNFYNE